MSIYKKSIKYTSCLGIFWQQDFFESFEIGHEWIPVWRPFFEISGRRPSTTIIPTSWKNSNGEISISKKFEEEGSKIIRKEKIQ